MFGLLTTRVFQFQHAVAFWMTRRMHLFSVKSNSFVWCILLHVFAEVVCHHPIYIK
jgi:hypothetical protein